MLQMRERRLRAVDAVHNLHLQPHGLSTSYWAIAYPNPTPPAAHGPRLRAVDAVHDLHLQAQAAQLREREVRLGLVAGQRDEVRLPGHLRVLPAHARAVAEAVPGLRARGRGASEYFLIHKTRGAPILFHAASRHHFPVDEAELSMSA